MNTEAIERPVVREARSIKEFCEAWSIPLATYFRLKKSGLMPEVMEVGRRRLITTEAERAWKQQRCEKK